MRKHTVSVIIPCHNSGNYVVNCLDSLAHQSIQNFDVFLIDDCSTDNTTHIIEDYMKFSPMTIHLLKNDINCGPAASRKRGILASNADFICFCDSDDWYDTNYLQEMTGSQVENNSDVVFCSFRRVFDSGKKIQRLIIYDNEDFNNTNRTLVKAPDSLCLMMVRRDILLKVPYPDMRNGEDMALIPLLVSSAKRVSGVNKCLYNYYCRYNSASTVATMRMIESLEASYSFIAQNLSPEYHEEKEFIGIRNLLYGGLLNLFKFSDNRNKANQIVDDFETKFPFWYNNPYLEELPLSKRLFLKCIEKRWWIFAKIISHLQSLFLILLNN